MALRLTRTTFSWYFPVFFIILLAIGIISSIYVYRSVNASLRQSLIYRAETIALALDPQQLAFLSGSEADMLLPEYSTLKAKITNIRETNKDSRFVYIMAMRNNEMYFVVDSENPESEDYSPPGQIYYEESAAFEDAFVWRRSGSEGPTSDRWGTWITAVAPIMDVDGNVIAAVGIDVDANEFKKQLVTYTVLPLVATLILVVFVYFGMRLRRQERDFIDIKSKFVAVASHDIRSPLTGLSWAMQALLESQTLQGEDRRLATGIGDKVKHLLATSNDILDALSADIEEVHILRSELRLADIIKRSADSLEYFAHQEQVEMVVGLIPPDALVIGDPGKLQQLFINLLSNAIKYSHSNTKIGLTYASDEKWHTITVIDQGIGIPEKDQKDIFKGFYRAHNAESLSVQGTGLGLYLVKRITELHGGKISLESQENTGTKVTVQLPRFIKPL